MAAAHCFAINAVLQETEGHRVLLSRCWAARHRFQAACLYVIQEAPAQRGYAATSVNLRTIPGFYQCLFSISFLSPETNSAVQYVESNWLALAKGFS